MLYLEVFTVLLLKTNMQYKSKPATFYQFQDEFCARAASLVVNTSLRMERCIH